jgi:undecaprenyl-diphosphatase
MRRAEPALALRHAAVLGLVQGPAELLPISSSAHTALLPWFAGWPYARLDGESRKSFEVAVHAGAGVALAIDMRAELPRALAGLNRRRCAAFALALAPPALAGLALRAAIERRLGGPRSIAAGLTAGGLAMALADARMRARRGTGRRCADAAAGDGLALGLAQASALAPGVSRNGATIAAALLRGFAREDAERLSWLTALPVILGASALEGARLARAGEAPSQAPALATGAFAALLSTLVSARLLPLGRRGGRSLLPYALYRCLLATLVLRRLRRPQ